jgi:hypothetical protein
MFHIVVGANLHPFFSRYPVSAVVFTLNFYSPGNNKNCWSAWKSSNRLLLFTRPGIVVTDVLWKITLATWQVHTFNSNSFAWKMSIRRVWDINSEKKSKRWVTQSLLLPSRVYVSSLWSMRARWTAARLLSLYLAQIKELILTSSDLCSEYDYEPLYVELNDWFVALT